MSVHTPTKKACKHSLSHAQIANMCLFHYKPHWAYYQSPNKQRCAKTAIVVVSHKCQPFSKRLRKDSNLRCSITTHHLSKAMVATFLM